MENRIGAEVVVIVVDVVTITTGSVVDVVEFVTWVSVVVAGFVTLDVTFAVLFWSTKSVQSPQERISIGRD